MLTVNWVQFVLNLIIAGFTLRMAQVYLAGTDLGRALAFIY
jgi:hypothetical protein